MPLKKEYRSVFTYSLVMDMRMRIHIFGFAHTGKTRAYATGHMPFHDPRHAKIIISDPFFFFSLFWIFQSAAREKLGLVKDNEIVFQEEK